MIPPNSVWRCVIIGVACLLVPWVVQGKPGRVDPTFDTSSGTAHSVRILAVDGRGRIVIGGWFVDSSGQSRRGLARLLPDGRLDHEFSALENTDGVVEFAEILPDGRLIVGGKFTTIQGVPRPGLARLYSDGALDLGYAPAGLRVLGYRHQADGKVLAEVDDDRGLVRLLSDGGVDSTFNGSVGWASPRLIGVLADRRVLITRVVAVKGELYSELIRLDADGGVDATFNPTLLGWAGAPARLIAELPDGAVLIHERSVGRLFANGGWDSGFSTFYAQAADSIDDHWLQTVAAGPDNSLYIGGRYELKHPDFMDGDEAFDRGYVRRVSPVNGMLDATFSASFDAGPPGRPSRVDQVVVMADGRLLVAGWFSAVNGAIRRFLVRLDSRGRTDRSFNANQGADGAVFAILPLSDGKVVVGGRSRGGEDIGQRSLVRLEARGAVDPSFEAVLRDDETYGPPILSLVMQAGGGIVAGSVDEGMIRMHPDGSQDQGFSLNTWIPDSWSEPDEDEFRVVQQSDGRILAGGIVFSDPVTWTESVGIGRFNPDGSPDPSFEAGLRASGSIRVLALDARERILVGGDFITVGDPLRIGLVRLLTDGRLDPTFDAGIRTNEMVRCLAIQPDGRILVGVSGNTFAGVPRHGLVRLTADGEPDRSFAPVLGRDDAGSPPVVYALAIQGDGKVVIGGSFGTIEGLPRRNLARLNEDGSLDRTFDTGGGPDGDVLAIALRSDGRILIGGEFQTVDGHPRHHIAQLLARPEHEVMVGPTRRGAGGPAFELVGATIRTVAIETSSDLVHWIRRETLEVGPRPVLYSDVEPGNSDRRFYRVVWDP